MESAGSLVDSGGSFWLGSLVVFLSGAELRQGSGRVGQVESAGNCFQLEILDETAFLLVESA